MLRTASHRPDFSARLSFWLLIAFLSLLFAVGGASRTDVLGQPVTRFAAWAFLVVFALLSPRFDLRQVKPVAVLVAFAVLMVSLQLVPLPPSIWMALPGRDLFIRAAEVSGQPQPWRPLSVSPAATANALGSLIVPVVTLALVANLSRSQHWHLAAFILFLIFCGCILALLQFSGASFSNPLINFVSGSVSGNFANRNHFALFVALGCLIAPILGWRENRHIRWKTIVGIALLPFLVLVVLATGSRSGMLLCGAGIAGGLFTVRKSIIRDLQALPLAASATFGAVAVLGLVGLVLLSLKLGRAIGIDRAFASSGVDDLRVQALPYVLDAVGRYFPAGAGFGTFDPVYRIGEPDALLTSRYFNHAHNDWLEIILDGGIGSAALLFIALSWFAFAIIRLRRRGRDASFLGALGAIALLMIMIASITDYPARTPLIMAIVVIAATWLHVPKPSSLSSRELDNECQ